MDPSIGEASYGWMKYIARKEEYEVEDERKREKLAYGTHRRLIRKKRDKKK